jgi:hypothetical protein
VYEDGRRMFVEIAAEVVVEVIVATGVRITTAIKATRRGSRRRRNAEVTAWFEGYRPATTGPPVPDAPPGVTPDTIEAWLGGDSVQAILHELLAVRLSGAPEIEATRLAGALRTTLEPYAVDRVAADDFARAAFAHFDHQMTELTRELAAADPDLLRWVREEALSTRIAATLAAIERHTAALATTSDPAADREFLARYRRHVVEHHGLIEPPDFDRRRRVPLDDLYVPSDITEIVDAGPDEHTPKIDIWALGRLIDRTVLLGDPGGGKSTACNVLLHHNASDAARRVPFLVVLREFAAADPPAWSVVEFIEHRLTTFYQCKPPPGLIERLLLNGAAMVAFDGLDELVETSRRAEVTSIVERFCATYPLAPVLVTSRFVGYDEARLDERQFVCYSVGGFDDARVTEYVKKWFALEDDSDSADAGRLADAFMAETEKITDLRANPFLLALMCILYRGEGSLPRTRPEVYEHCAMMLFHKWDARRRIQVDLRARNLIEPILRHLAYWLFARADAGPAVTARELVAETADLLYERGFETRDQAVAAAREFVAFCRGRAWVFSDMGTNAHGENLYAFTHRTFMEYFAAAYLASQHDTPEQLARRLAPHIAKREWDTVAQLAVQIKDRFVDRGAERICLTLLHERRRRSAQGRSNVLQFLARCLGFIDVSPRVVRDLTRTVLDHAFDGAFGEARRNGPVEWLTACAVEHRTYVREEITARIERELASTEPGDRLAPLLVAGYLDQMTWNRSRSERPSSEQQLFWDEVGHHLILEYADELRAAAADDLMLLDVTLVHGLTEAASVLEQRGLSTFFQSWSSEIIAWQWVPYAVRSLAAFLAARAGSTLLSRPPASIAAASLDAIGSWIDNNPEPPFVTDPDGWQAFFNGFLETLERDPDTEPPLSPCIFLGAAITLLISAEATPNIDLSRVVPGRLGPLRPLHSYLVRRLGRRDSDKRVELPELPVPEEFQRLLRRWANREVDFARRT